jgi:hypothetical protein
MWVSIIQTPSGNVWRPLERVSIIAPLGIRFWDPAFDEQITDGLIVTAWPADTRWPARTAYVTSGGIYAFRGLPGLHDVEYPSGSPARPGSLPAARRFLIEVADTNARFLPIAFFVDAPYNGIFPTTPSSSSSMPALPGFYLFSAPTRPATSLVALVRAQLSERIDDFTEQPAPYAVLEIDTPDGETWYGLADACGAVAALFPYPNFTPTDNSAGSLPSPAPASQQSWPLTLRVRYQPSVVSLTFGSSLPELRSVLAQAPAAIWTQRASPPGITLPSQTATLIFGQQLTMRSAGESVVLISPGSLP